MSYAKVDGFDPLKPENWYSQKKRKLMKVKVCTPLPIVIPAISSRPFVSSLFLLLTKYRGFTDWWSVTTTAYHKLSFRFCLTSV